MIISEVLDAIDIINSITLESEIDTCESLLSSYDKMSIIIESCENDNLDDFKIIQEGKNFDKFKEEFNKQNEGKSTLNKIIFAIPRIIMSLIRLILSKFKKNEEVIEKIDEPLKDKKNGGAVVGSLIGLFASALSVYGTAKYVHMVYKNNDPLKYGDTNMSQFLAMVAKEDFPNVYKFCKKIKNKINWVKLRNAYKSSHKMQTDKQLKSPENQEIVKELTESGFQVIINEVLDIDAADCSVFTKNTVYCNRLYKTIVNDSIDMVARLACIIEFKPMNDDLIKTYETLINKINERAKNDIENAEADETIKTIEESRDIVINKTTSALDELKKNKTKVLEIEKKIGPIVDNRLNELKKSNNTYSTNVEKCKNLCKQYSKSKLAYEFGIAVAGDKYCIRYNISDVISSLIKKLENLSNIIDAIKNRKTDVDKTHDILKSKPDYKSDEPMSNQKKYIMDLIKEDIIKSGDKIKEYPVKDIKSSIESNMGKHMDVIKKFENKLKEVSFVISDDEQNQIFKYIKDHALFISSWCECYYSLIERITYMNSLVKIKEIRDLYKEWN